MIPNDERPEDPPRDINAEYSEHVEKHRIRFTNATTIASFGPMCRCGSRDTLRIGESALQRQCQECGHTYFFRVCGGHVVPLAPESAQAMDEERGVSRWSLERMTAFLRRAGVRL